MSDKIQDIDYKIWITKTDNKYGGLNHYFVPKGILIEGYDDKGIFKSKVDNNTDDLSEVLQYDVKRLLEPLQKNKPISMILETISYMAWLRNSLYKKRYHSMNQGMKFVIGYLKHVLTVI